VLTTYTLQVTGLPYSSTPARDSSRIHPVDLFRCPSRPRAPLLLEGITLPSSLIRAHASDQNPPLNFAFCYSERSLQVAVSPCWTLALPDLISTILACLLRPISRGVSPVPYPFLPGKHRPRRRTEQLGTPIALQCNFNRGHFETAVIP